jgi:predicted DNA-binding transcriptional regulator AlpA
MSDKLVTMVAGTDRYLSTTEEASVVDRNKGTVSRARQDPTHPANGPSAVRVGRASAAPESEIRAWWATRTDGRPRTTPPGLTPALWAALQAFAVDIPVAPVMVRRLQDKRLIGVQGRMTALGRKTIEQYAPKGEQ